MSFVLSRLIWLVLNPLTILLVLICLALFMQVTVWRRSGRRLLFFCATILVLLSVLPIGQLMLAALEGQYPPLHRPPARVDGIILLGGAGAQPHIAFAALARRYPEAKLVYSGGRGGLRQTVLSQADLVAKLLKDDGLDTSRILFEAEARNTHDSPRLILERLQPGKGEVWLLVTSASHMARSLGVFRKQGWNVIAYPCDYRTKGGMNSLALSFDISNGLRQFAIASRAWIGLAGYYIMGRTSAFLPPAFPPPPAG